MTQSWREPKEPIYDDHGNLLCGANRRAVGKPCRKRAGQGTSHPGYGTCHLHGGSTRNMNKRAATLKADELVEKVRDELLVDTGAMPITDPVTKLQQVAGGLSSALDKVTERVNALTSVEVDNYGKDDAVIGHQIAVEVALWERVTKMLSSLLVDMAKLGIADRQTRIDEQQGMLIAECIRLVLADLRLSVEQQALVPDVVPRHLRTIAGQLAP